MYRNSSPHPSLATIVLQGFAAVIFLCAAIFALCFWQYSPVQSPVFEATTSLPAPAEQPAIAEIEAPPSMTTPALTPEVASSDDVIFTFVSAAERGDQETILNLLEQGVYVDSVDADDHWTALIHACNGGQLETARLLLEKGANVNAKHVSSSYTPLTMALSFGHGDIARLLIAHGVDIHAPGPEGETCLALAVGHKDIELVREFLAHGVDVNKKNDFDQPPLALAIGNLEMLRLLLENGADPNTNVHFDWEDSVFMSAVKAGDLEGARLMLAHGANVNHEGRYGRSALDYARENKNEAMIAFLKQAGAREH